MGKGNDKSVVMEARQTLLRALGNLLESHRERKFVNPATKKALSRKEFCQNNGLIESTVAHIETGRFLSLQHPQFRRYLAVTHRNSNKKFAESMRTVHAGLKEIEAFLKRL